MIVAVIPARGGSKRIPRKNIRPFAGKPIIAYSIAAARACGLFDRIIVSADEDPRAGLSYDDLRWLLERVKAEILILRPAPEDTRQISVEGVNGHF